MEKILLINKYAPPQIEGVAILLGRVLKYFPKNSCAVLCDGIYKKNIAVDVSQTLPFRYYYFYLPEYNYRGNSGLLRIVSEFLPFLLIPFLVLKGLFVIKKEKVKKILAANSSGIFLISAYYISRLTNRGLYVYLFDVFKYAYLSKVQRGFARLYEEGILKSAKCVFVTSEKMQEHYKNEYGLTTELIPHPAEASEKRIKKERNEKEYKIVFAGRINKFTVDSLQRLVRAVKEMSNVRLDLYIPDLEHFDVKAIGLTGPNVVLKSALVKDMPCIQSEADLLFSPMGFDKNRPQEYIMTASPGKIGEYLVSGVPILINAPEHSYISWYAKKHSFAFVVNSKEERELRDAVSILLKNKPLREKLVNNALILSKKHEAAVVSTGLQSFIYGE